MIFQMKKNNEIKEIKKSPSSNIVSEINRSKINKKQEKEDEALLCEKMNFSGREAYKLLRTNLLFTLADNSSCKVVGVSSSVRGEGKSTCSINLAYTLAQSGSKVLIVDMDMRLPSIAKKLHLDDKLGLSDFLINNASKKDIIKPTKYENLDLVLSITIPPNPSELIQSEAMTRFINSLKKEYDFIVLDLPPVNVVSDALAAKDLMDGILVVVREGYTDKYSLADCVRQLQFMEFNILGFVLTNAGGELSYSSKYNKYKRYKYYKYNKYKYYSHNN